MRLLITFLALSLGLMVNAQNTGITITVTIENIKSNEGKVLIGLHNSETFMRADGLDNVESTIENNKATLVFKNVKPGQYALLAMHDENENYMMDFEASGMPKESFGLSNNPMSFGPPQFNEAKFAVNDKDLNFTIRF
jgi:uncharacterized protein (DUF2141 family)